MRVLVRVVCAVMLAAAIGCGDSKTKTSAPQNTAPPPNQKPQGIDSKGGGASAPPVKP
ncbi:MAG TPA: hypothetical protein VLM40_07080 [Gemmata sp.]|nr:hypothetical protein [Gemmata sp.]